MLENSKIEVVVDLGTDYEYGVACRGRQLFGIPEEYHMERSRSIAASNIRTPAVVNCR